MGPRGKEWEDLRGLGNPAFAPDLKRYKTAVSLEHAKSHVTPIKVTPLFTDKLHMIMAHL